MSGVEWDRYELYCVAPKRNNRIYQTGQCNEKMARAGKLNLKNYVACTTRYVWESSGGEGRK